MTLSEMERMAALGLQEVNEEDRLSDTEDPELLVGLHTCTVQPLVTVPVN